MSILQVAQRKPDVATSRPAVAGERMIRYHASPMTAVNCTP